MADMEEFSKQSGEAWTIAGDFSENMESTESIASHTVTCVDDNGEDATSTILSDDAVRGQRVEVFVQDGSDAVTPYIITFRIVTNTTPAHKWELDVKMVIKEVGE